MQLFRNVFMLLFFLKLLFISTHVIGQAININNIEWPPFFFSNIKKGQQGFGKEILNFCLSQHGYSYQYKTLPIKRTHTYMQMGEIDISIYSYKKERDMYVHFGKEPIFTSTYGLMSKKEDNIKIEKFDDINKYTIGHLSGLTHTPELLELIKQKAQKNEVSFGLRLDDMFQQMFAIPPRFQLMPNSKETFLWRAKQLGVTEQITVHDFVLAEKNYYVAVSKFSKNIPHPNELLNNIDSCIRKLKLSGLYQQKASKYGL